MDINETYDKRHEMDPSRPWQAFWDQVTTAEPPLDEELSAARSSRTEAERERQKTADEILEATKEVCQRLMADAERAMERARFLEGEADQMHQESGRELERAEVARSEAGSYRERVMVDAQQQAQEILERARSEAQSECQQLKEQAWQEAQKVMARVEVMKSAAQEELEAQRIYTESARLKTESHEILRTVGGILGEMPTPKEPGTNGHSPNYNGLEELNTIVAAQPSDLAAQPPDVEAQSSEPAEAPAGAVVVKAHHRRTTKRKKSA